MQHSSVSLATYLLAAFIIFTLGFAWAVMKRANKDYKAVKAAVKPARKAFWASAWLAVKAAFWVVLAGLILVAWQVRDVRDGDDKTPILPAKNSSARPAK